MIPPFAASVVTPKVLVFPRTKRLSCISTESLKVLKPTKVETPLTVNSLITVPDNEVPAPTSKPLTVSVSRMLTDPRTSKSTSGSKIVDPIPTRPTTSNTFCSSVLPSTPIFCCCCLPLRNLIGAAISYIRD